MGRKMLCILLVIALCLSALFCGLWIREKEDLTDARWLCTTAACAAAEEFLQHCQAGEPSDYWTAVGEYRAFMRAYHVLVDAGVGDSTYYVYCNQLYGAMCISPEKTMAFSEKLYECMSWLSKDPCDEDAFYQIQWVNNQIDRGE